MYASSYPNNLRRAQREQLEEECATLEEQIRQLESEVTKKRSILAAKQLERSHLAPVYTLPDDIWFEILETAFAHHFPRCGDPQSTSPDSPIAFSHVSRRFREVVLALPNIWTCIHINPGQSPLYSKLLQEQLRRSKNSPLSIYFICKGPSEQMVPMPLPGSFPSHEFTAHFGACWQLLLSHAHRWRHLSFWAEHDLIVKELLQDSNEMRGDPLSFPQLEHLDVCINSEDLYPQPASGCSLKLITQDTPRLSALRLRDVFPSSILSLGLNNITRLTLVQQDLQLPQLEQMLLAMAGTLSALLLDTVDLGGPHVSNKTTPSSLPHLRHLVLKDVQPFDVFVHRFSSSAPNLLQLEIWAPTPMDELFPQSVRSSIVFPALKKLSLISFGVCDPIPLFQPTLLEFFPVLEHIDIREELSLPFTLACLEAIRESLNTESVTSSSLPPLKKIWVSNTGDKEFFNMLVQIIRRKAELSCPLEEVVILQRHRGYMAEDKDVTDGQDHSDHEPEFAEFEFGEEQAVSSILRYEWDEWFGPEGSRFQEWETAHNCPTLPFWMRGVEEY